jgi:hypothetical protein
MAILSDKTRGMPVDELQKRRNAFCEALSAMVAEKVAEFEEEIGVRIENDDIRIDVQRVGDRWDRKKPKEIVVYSSFNIVI